MALPTNEIQTWSDERLIDVIKAGEAINWNISLGESQEEIDNYTEILYAEAFNRKLTIS